MAAEVKVKITAQNEVQTGLQASLAQVKQFAGEAQRTMQQAFQGPRAPVVQQQKLPSGPINIDIGDYGLGPLRDLQEQLRRVRQSAQDALNTQPVERFDAGIAGVVARFALLIGGAVTFGKILASTFESVSNVIREQIGLQRQFNEALSQSGKATNLSGAISEFRQLNSAVSQMRASLEESMGANFGTALSNAISGRPGQLMSRVGNLLSLNYPIKTVEANIAANQESALKALQASLDTQINNAQDIAATAGNRDAADAVRKKQERDAAIAELKAALDKANATPQQANLILRRTNELFRLQDQDEANQKRLETEKEITAEKEKQAKQAERQAERERAEAERKLAQEQRAKERRDDFNLNTSLMDARLRKDKAAEENILQQQDFQKAMDATGSFEDAANFAATAAELRAQQSSGGNMTGSFGASSLQRIGFASNEFFDTRRREDPSKETKRAADAAKQIYELLKKGEPLVLPASS